MIAGLGASTAYYYTRYQKAQLFLSNPNEASKEEIKSISQELGKLIELPRDDEPTVATILDKNKLKNEPFFTKAENGDKVILYTKSLKAILFRPSTGKVINFASLNISTPSAQTAQPVRIVIYNGTETTGLTQTLEKDLTSKANNIKVVSRENAKKTDYAKTLVVDLTGNQADVAEQLAQLAGGSVGKLPEEETNPGSSAEFLIIVGKDYTEK